METETLYQRSEGLYLTFSLVLCQVLVHTLLRVASRNLPEVSANLPAHFVAKLRSQALDPTFAKIKDQQHISIAIQKKRCLPQHLRNVHFIICTCFVPLSPAQLRCSEQQSERKRICISRARNPMYFLFKNSPYFLSILHEFSVSNIHLRCLFQKRLLQILQFNVPLDNRNRNLFKLQTNILRLCPTR